MSPRTGYLAFRERQFLKPLFLILCLMGVLLYSGKTFGFFDEPTLGFDKLLHFFGGNVCGIFGVGLLSIGCWNEDALCTARTTNIRIWIITTTLALGIGVGYEMLQAWAPFFQNGNTHGGYDTIGDVMFDVLGGIAAGLAYQVRRN